MCMYVYVCMVVCGDVSCFYLLVKIILKFPFFFLYVFSPSSLTHTLLFQFFSSLQSTPLSSWYLVSSSFLFPSILLFFSFSLFFILFNQFFLPSQIAVSFPYFLISSLTSHSSHHFFHSAFVTSPPLPSTFHPFHHTSISYSFFPFIHLLHLFYSLSIFFQSF